MMFSNLFAIAIKVNGKVLRESGDSVHLPFGSEYSILLKNLNSVRADVKVQVDGQDASGGSLIVNSGASIDLERFIKNGNLDRGNKFKFIERSASVEDHRGIGVEDGLVRVEYRFEKVEPKMVEYVRHIYRDEYHEPWYPAYPNPYHPIWPPRPWISYNSTTRSSGISGQSMGAFQGAQNLNCVQGMNASGITVPGSESSQKFVHVKGFPLEAQAHVIVLRLFGAVGEQAVTKPVTVKSKPKCVTCGKSNKSNLKFCGNCGTALEII